ncbi:MAG: NAD(P)(+) transhydrogenase (Re/Si-specific) subunit alpha, partial [Chloroflexi bacterium]|nr:NAD(P)(+) transhydrogenase (Re/Si-specific) subunit alpha [Chloroflexota bacterium]
EEAHRKEVELLAKAVKDNDIVVTTAAIPGRKAPVLITKDMVPNMRPGSVIVDLAAETGGNCELTEVGTVVVKNDVTIVGTTNLPSTMPYHASQMYSRNIAALLALFLKDGKAEIDLTDDVLKGTVITQGGQVVHEATKKLLGPAASA